MVEWGEVGQGGMENSLYIQLDCSFRWYLMAS